MPVRHLPGMTGSAAKHQIRCVRLAQSRRFGHEGRNEHGSVHEGTFGGKEVAPSRQIGMVMGNRHASVIALPQALRQSKRPPANPYGPSTKS